MTKELAIRIITGDVLGTSEQTHEAIKMAVSALSHPDVADINVGDTISRQAAIDAIGKASDELYENIKKGATFPQRQWFDGMAQAQSILEDLPSAEQKNGRYVDLSERVIGYYYDDEYEEWIEKTVTVEELLDTACEDYTVVEMPSVEPQRMKGKWIELTNILSHTYICSVCGRMLVNIPDGKNKVTKNYPFCHCGADMRGEQDG